MITRTFDLSDLTVRSEGDGRTIVAYAAVFNTPAEIRDHDGHYNETIDPTAFNRTLADNKPGTFRALFNHGMSLHGTPSDRFSMPYGVVQDAKVDAYGLLTTTRASETDLGDEVLQLAKDGALQGFSFSAQSIKSERRDPMPGAGIDTIHRQEFALNEFGPAVFPAYREAELVGVRSNPATEDGEQDRNTDPLVDPQHSVLAKTDTELAQYRALLVIKGIDKQ